MFSIGNIVGRTNKACRGKLAVGLFILTYLWQFFLICYGWGVTCMGSISQPRSINLKLTNPTVFANPRVMMYVDLARMNKEKFEPALSLSLLLYYQLLIH